MARATVSSVRKIIDSGKDDTFVEASIRSANVLVDRLVGKGMENDQLREIEIWLSAHFLSVTDRLTRFKEEKTGQSFALFEGSTKMGLEYTPFGQQAMVLDTSGTLLKVSQNKQAKIQFVDDPSYTPSD